MPIIVTTLDTADSAFKIVDADEIMDIHEMIDESKIIEPLEALHPPATLLTPPEPTETPLETEWIRVEVSVRPLGTEWVRVELPDSALDNILVFEAVDGRLDAVAEATEPPLPPIKILTLEEVLAGVTLLASTPLALDSQEMIALANPAAAILGDKEVVSREVFDQAMCAAPRSSKREARAYIHTDETPQFGSHTLDSLLSVILAISSNLQRSENSLSRSTR